MRDRRTRLYADVVVAGQDARTYTSSAGGPGVRLDYDELDLDPSGIVGRISSPLTWDTSGNGNAVLGVLIWLTSHA
jgi:hypothetical protein